jgi:hypothetical protein
VTVAQSRDGRIAGHRWPHCRTFPIRARPYTKTGDRQTTQGVHSEQQREQGTSTGSTRTSSTSSPNEPLITGDAGMEDAMEAKMVLGKPVHLPSPTAPSKDA